MQLTTPRCSGTFRVQTSYGIHGTVLDWFKSYLHNCQQSVRCKSDSSTQSLVVFGAPQGSVLGPIIFLLYTADILGVVRNRNLHAHLYVDDTQIYGFCCPSKVSALQDNVSACIDDVAIWMKSNRLQLNATKTEVLSCAHPRGQQQLPKEPLCIGCDTVQPVAYDMYATSASTLTTG